MTYDYVMLSAAAEATRNTFLCLWAVVSECSVPRPTRGTGDPEPLMQLWGAAAAAELAPVAAPPPTAMLRCRSAPD